MSNFTSAQRVVESPQLLSLVCDFAGKNDRVSLLRVSRRVFDCAVTSLWKSIFDIKILFRLLPGVTVTKVGEKEGWIINFPATIDMSRFNTYAPFIKHLEIVSSAENGTSLRLGENAQSFLASARTATLTPNLAKLAVVVSEINSEEHVHWVEMFLSSSLLDIELVYYSGTSRWVGLNSASVLGLLEKISYRCPNLQQLEVFPSGGVTDDRFDGSTTPNPEQLELLDSLRARISSFRNLRTFKSSVFILRPGILSALGELPHLEMLSINGNCRESHIVGLALPDSSFPALRTLELRNLHWANLQYLSSFTPLVRQLTKIVMTHADDNGFWHYEWDEEIENEGDWTMDLVSNMAKNTPLLTSLAVHYGGTDSIANLSSDWLPSLQALGLKHLSLQNVEFECSWREFTSVLPNLEEFQASELSFGAISQLAKRLPRLRLLELDSIDLGLFKTAEEHEEASDDQKPEAVKEEDEKNVQANKSNGRERLQLKAKYRIPSGARIDSQKIQDIARFFHTCRPSLECVNVEDNWNSPKIKKSVREMINSLNRAIAVLNI
ncbi:hypothetical protein BDV93DRAFT_543772 [Ceratobasidium sp. AG-I]|nr:hypothetical protein BDV93DRAFT_543772 [Ceratobasidium sp. AG-I]